MSDLQDLSEKSELTFEGALVELETIVQQLEGNAESLAESVALFQRGRELADFCQTLLDKAELQITKLNQADDGSQTIEPFVVETSDT
jgi:exodeoxyribonuclease VII small subunit